MTAWLWIGCDLADGYDSERLRGFDFRQTDRRTDICNCRVAFATENSPLVTLFENLTKDIRSGKESIKCQTHHEPQDHERDVLGDEGCNDSGDETDDVGDDDGRHPAIGIR